MLRRLLRAGANFVLVPIGLIVTKIQEVEVVEPGESSSADARDLALIESERIQVVEPPKGIWFDPRDLISV